MTFEKGIFKNVLELEPEWEIIDHNLGEKAKTIKVTKIEKPKTINIKDITQEISKPELKKEKFNTKDYSVANFNKNIKTFSESELKEFEKDSRKTISKLAKKILLKKS